MRVAIRPFRIQVAYGTYVDFSEGQNIPAEFEAHWFAIQNSEEKAHDAIEVPAAHHASPMQPPPPPPPPPPADDEGADEAAITKDHLIARAKELGVVVDGRWGPARIEQEIAKALGAANEPA